MAEGQIPLETLSRIARLEKALRDIRALKPRPIGNTGFMTGPAALLDQAKGIAYDALKGARK